MRPRLMPDPIQRFLRHRPTIPNQSPLGRVYGVTRETWRLDDDPAQVAPERLAIATGRSASEAADIARAEAQALPRSGFHKPSAAWWGVEAGRFHRFLVAPRTRRPAFALTAGLVGLAVLAVVRSRKSPPAGPPRKRRRG